MGRLRGGIRAARLHPLVGIISVGSLSHVASAPFNLTLTHMRVRECPVLWSRTEDDRSLSCQKLRHRLRNSAPVRYFVPLEFSIYLRS